MIQSKLCLLMLVLAVGAVGVRCAAPQAGGPGAADGPPVDQWGYLGAQDLHDLEKLRWRNRSRWKLATGIAVGAAGLASTGVGAGYLVWSSSRRADAERSQDPHDRDRFAEQAENHKAVGLITTAVGAPLALAGVALVVWDLLETPPPEPLSSVGSIRPCPPLPVVWLAPDGQGVGGAVQGTF